MGFANLHIHSHFSDGLLSPNQLIEEVFRHAELQAFALTDHDSLSGIEPVFRRLAEFPTGAFGQRVRFIPGVELSLLERSMGITVHLLGLFPQMTLSNHREILGHVDAILGPYCRIRCLQRGERDLDARVRKAYEENLEGIQDRYSSSKEVVSLLRKWVEYRNRFLFEVSGKEEDIIQHPIPLTYQVLLDHWIKLLPHSTFKKAELFILHRNAERINRLKRLYQLEGISVRKASEQAEMHAGILAQWSEPPPYADILEGLDLLKQAKAVTILAHPALDQETVERETFDRVVTLPLIQAGLDGIEVYYPYGASGGPGAERHYGTMAEKYDLLVGGGTDYHGDGRAGLADIRLPIRYVRQIMARGKALA